MAACGVGPDGGAVFYCLAGLGEVGAEFELAVLDGSVLVVGVGNGIEMLAGEGIDGRWQLLGVRSPVVLDVVAELVELLDALGVGAERSLRARGAELQESEDEHEGYDG